MYSLQWTKITTELGVYLYGRTRDIENKTCVAVFDLDYTIIKTKSGRKFPKDESDWDYLFECIPHKLKDIHFDDYNIVIISNQNKLLDPSKNKDSQFKIKLQNIVSNLKIPCEILVAIEDDGYRKPYPGLWDAYRTMNNNNLEDSFYCGDAAGRPAGWAPKMKADFSCSDRKFALNCSLKFKTPEEFFLDVEEQPFSFGEKSWNPGSLDIDVKMFTPSSPPLILKSVQEMVILVGYPASGKSSFANFFEQNGYKIICQDILKTKPKCKKACVEFLKEGHSVVIDSTNPDIESRKFYTQLAKGIQIRCLYFNVSFEMAFHINRFRSIISDRTKVPIIVYRIFKKKFQMPELSEGFTEIKIANFVPQFKHKKSMNLFMCWSPDM